MTNTTEPDWSAIHTLFLDMDGTLLDLHFDNYFWQEHVPQRYAEINELEIERARELLYPRFQAAEGTMEWYCVDYWSQELGLDIAMLKEEVDHLIAIHPHVVDFLEALERSGRRRVLVTNAHQKSLALKMEKTQLAGHFEKLSAPTTSASRKRRPASGMPCRRWNRLNQPQRC